MLFIHAETYRSLIKAYSPVLNPGQNLNRSAQSKTRALPGKRSQQYLMLIGGFQVTPVVKNLPANAGDAGSIPGLGRFPGGRNGNPLQDSCLENPIPLNSLVGYSPWSHKDSDHN